MKSIKPIRLVSAAAILLLLSQPAAAQSLNWVHQSTGIMGPEDSIAIGFTGPWVNVFYQQTVGQNIEIRGLRQFPAPNPTNNMNYVPYPAPLAMFPSTAEMGLIAVASPFGITMPPVDIALVARTNDPQFPSQLFRIAAVEPRPPAPVPDVEAVAFRPNGELVTFDAGDLNAAGIVGPDMVVGAGATDLDVALVDFMQVNPQNNIYEIRYRQTAFGTGVYLPHVVVASVPGLEPETVDFTMTAGGIPHVVFSHPGTRQIISRQFDPKVNAWTTDVLGGIFGIINPCNNVASRGDLVAATWADANPNNPNATALDIRIAIKDGDGPWQTSNVCTACAGNPEQLDITIGPDGFPVIAYVSPTNQLMVAYDPLSPEPALPGDVNLDGVVNRSDVALMALNYATAGFSINATTDLDGDGQVAVADLSFLQAHLGQYLTGESPAAVPEPATLWLAIALAAAAALTSLKRKRRSRAI